MLEYKLIRSKRRKTLALQVKHGQVTVRAPHYVTSAFIDTFIQEKSAWLRSKLAEQQKTPDYCDFSQGSNLLYLGEKVILNICIAKKSEVYFSHLVIAEIEPKNYQEITTKQLNVAISEKIHSRLINPLAISKQIKKQLEVYFKQQAEQLFSERLERISKQISLCPTAINIRQYRARWGSCNNRGEVNFNYLLMMTPLTVIDYVIVHELCHLEHLNHSKEFWHLVEKFCPNYDIAKKWLNTYQSQLQWQNPH
ncbi:M48 family metallopeptidase [Colwellia sp. Bg11-28]|uniref:M48 family metallopeptidase n=1 Tax=Colwellia sp. Bg11-28 TaxID=2058305 RepID=UPI000C348169|nr:SprT family zinc-dependent metalloprotease [Colwellia sp. Bg11-28]PKH85413.1 M48 family peptidase [Colwellia sp. Bg11-28]